MRRRALLFGVIALLSLALYGCDLDEVVVAAKPITVETTAPGLQPGWLRYASGDDFTLDVPAGWVKLEVSGDDLSSVLELLGKENNQLAEYMNSSDFKRQLGQLASQGVRLLLYDTDVNLYENPYATNLNVIRMDVPKGYTLDMVIEKNLEELNKVLGPGLLTDIKREYASLAGKTGEKISYDYRVNIPYGGYIDAHMQQYITLQDNAQYILTLTTTTHETRWRNRTFDDIAKSFKLTK